MSLKNPPVAKIAILLTDMDDGRVTVKLISDPPKSEWDSENFSSAMVLALLAMGAVMDGGEVETAPAVEERN